MEEMKKVAAKIAAEESANAETVTAGKKPFKKPFKKQKTADGLPITSANYPQHIVQMVMILKNNAEIRRFTALGILNYLLQKKEISGEHRYVSFKWNKFAVKANGLMREFSYTEPWFINALVASFTSFGNNAQRTIEAFLRKELHASLVEVGNNDEIAEIVAANEEHLNDAPEEIVDTND